jgi:hypothetical protein
VMPAAVEVARNQPQNLPIQIVEVAWICGSRGSRSRLLRGQN